MKLKLTETCSLDSNEKVVPTGGAFLRAFLLPLSSLLICASLLPSRQTRLDWITPVIAGGGGATVTGALAAGMVTPSKG